jgi:hypothetical protein
VRHILNNIGYCAFLIGLAPIFLARTWRGRGAAILFGTACVGLGLYFALSDTGEPESSQQLRRITIPIASALGLALISASVTFRLDRKHGTKA